MGLAMGKTAHLTEFALLLHEQLIDSPYLEICHSLLPYLLGRP